MTLRSAARWSWKCAINCFVSFLQWRDTEMERRWIWSVLIWIHNDTLCMHFLTAEMRWMCAGLLRTTPRPGFTCRGNKDREKKIENKSRFHQTLGFSFLLFFFLPTCSMFYMYHIKGQKKHGNIFQRDFFFPCNIQMQHSKIAHRQLRAV